jgi:lipopolysaccharide transport system permease protein
MFGIILIMSLLNARYRDVMPIAGVFCQIMPLLTPIAWQREMLKKYDWLADANPFYHLIEIVRAPLLGKLPEMLSYEVSLGMMVISLGLGLRLYGRARYRVIFWI